MKKIELFIHTAHSAEPKLVSIGETAAAADLIGELERAGHIHRESGEEILLFLDNHDEPLDREHRLCDGGVGHRHLLHCHSCRRVEVTIHYNGVTKERAFSPSSRISRVLKWAAGAFGLTGADAQGLELRLQCDANNPLPTDSHIGCYTRRGNCAVDLCLVPKVRVEG